MDIKWVKNDKGLIHTEIITIITSEDTFIIDNTMSGFEDMSDYILKCIDIDKISIVNKY